MSSRSDREAIPFVWFTRDDIVDVRPCREDVTDEG